MKNSKSFISNIRKMMPLPPCLINLAIILLRENHKSLSWPWPINSPLAWGHPNSWSCSILANKAAPGSGPQNLWFLGDPPHVLQHLLSSYQVPKYLRGPSDYTLFFWSCWLWLSPNVRYSPICVQHKGIECGLCEMGLSFLSTTSSVILMLHSAWMNSW